MHTIEVIVGPKGSIQLTVNGVTGKSCADITAAMEQALGVVEDRQLKPEYYVDGENVRLDVKQGKAK